MGAWIEIVSVRDGQLNKTVAPHMGAWIEILASFVSMSNLIVAPHMGAWIEIRVRLSPWITSASSHPTWVRGLKLPPSYIAN